VSNGGEDSESGYKYGNGPAYFDILFVFLIDNVDGLLHITEHEVAMTVISLRGR
jgi:hypothetical protein